MAARDYFAHDTPDTPPLSPFGRIAAAGCTGGSQGETLTAGVSTAPAVLASWQDDAHRNIVLDCTHADAGVGIGHGGSWGTYVTADFGGH